MRLDIGRPATALFVLFLVLKLVRIVSWPWLWVMSPLIVWLVVALVLSALRR